MFFEAILKMRNFLRKYVIYYKILGFVNNFKVKKDISVLKEYYSNCELFLPEDPGMRHFRFFLSKSKVIKIKSRITNKDDLRRYLVKYTPVTVHYSISKWKNPVGIGSRFYKKSAHNDVLVDNDLVFDVDSSDLERSRLESLKLISLMGKWHYPIKSIRFSGSKGFHLEFVDTVPNKVIKNNADREEYLTKKRKDLLARLRAENMQVDYTITANMRSLLRLPLTINSATGYICTPIDIKDFRKKSVKELLVNIKRLDYTAVAEGVDFENKFVKKARLYIKSKVEKKYPLSTSHTYDAYFFINKVYGLKENYIPIFRYSNTLLPDVLTILKKTQGRFRLTDIYLFRTNVDDEYFAFCIKTFDKMRMAKILKDSHSSNRRIVFSFAPEFVRISSKHISGRKAVEKPELIKILKSENKTNDASFVSRPHMKLIQNMGAYCYKYPNVHGAEDMKYYHSFIIDGQLKNSRLVDWKDVKL